MKYAIGILNWIKTNKILAFVLIGAITFSLTQIFKAKAKSNCEDCTPYQKIAEDLIAAFTDKETAYEPMINTGFKMFRHANYIIDTTKPMTQAEWNKYKDSVLAAAQRKLDSLKKTKNK